METLIAWFEGNWLGAVTVTISLTYMFLGLPHQIWTMWRSRSIEGVSVQMFILLAIQSLFWVFYGIQQEDQFVAIANTVAASFAIMIVIEYFLIMYKWIR